MALLLTGAAGFIGMHVARALLARGEQVVGVDNLNDYYDPALKRARLATLEGEPGFRFERLDVADREGMQRLFDTVQPRRVIHLAAQAGVRYSVENPQAYADSNLLGFMNILEGCRHGGIEHLVYASSSSVYGGNTRLPFREQDSVDHPVSLYAATKRANELMAHSYSHVFRLPATGLRFFTVYGPWGRPDMALFKFSQAMLAGREIEVYDHGRMLRDYTFIADVADAVLRVLDKPATPDPAFDPAAPDPGRSLAPHRVFNVGNSQPVLLIDFIRALEEALGVPARCDFKPRHPADMQDTAADCSALEAWIGHRPSTPLARGMREFTDWYRAYHAAP